MPIKEFIYNDGGRKAAGFTGKAGDCVCRAISIVSKRSYQEIYDRLSEGNKTQRKSKRSSNTVGKATASHGIHTTRKWFKDYMKELGFVWVPTSYIGQRTKIHLHHTELPEGRIIAKVSKHFTAVIDGVIHDTYDPRRFERDFRGNIQPTRLVYGYWRLDDE